MIRRIAAFLAFAAIGTSPGPAASQDGGFPSLAKRPVEATDRLSERTYAPVKPAAPDAALARTVQTLRDKASSADAVFRSELTKGRPAVSAAAGAAPSSEAWVAAQMSISAADAARYESVASLATLDTLAVERMDNSDVARVQADTALIEPARMAVLSMVDAQNDALDALRKNLTQP